MKKVLLVSPIPPPVGGIATWTQQLIEYHNDFNSEDVKLFHYNYNLRSRKITSKSFLSRVLSGLIDLVYHFKRLKSIRKELKPDVVHLTTSGALGLFKDYILLKYFIKNKVKTILHIRYGRVPEIKSLNNVEWKVLKRIVNLVDCTVVLDKKTKEVFSYCESKVKLIPNPIKDDKVLTNEKEIIENSIVFVGHVIKTKGIYELIEAFKQLNDSYCLRIIGPVEESVYSELVMLAGDSISRIVFMKSQNNNVVLDELRKCDLFILPSYTEGFPNVILEAMAQKCTVIATNVGAIPDILSDGCGKCILPKSSESILEAISYFEDMPSLKRDYGESAFSKVNMLYSFKEIYSKLEEVWKKI